MYVRAKTVNGYAIMKMEGTKGCYHVKTAENKEMTFKTIKAAAEFCKTLPYKPVKTAVAFGMVRTALGYITKEQMYFVLTDDNKRNKKTVDDFAKRNGCTLVEVWYRNDNAWDKVIPYKAYSYHHTIGGDTFEKLSIY